MTTTEISPPPMVVWPRRPDLVRAWTGPDDTTAETFPLLDGLEALTQPHAEDAHAVGYYVPGEDVRLPRLKLSSLAPLIAEGTPPVMRWVWVDVDRPGHAPWPTPASARDEVLAILSRTPPGPMQRAGWYATRAGFRLVWWLATPIDVRDFKSWAGQFHLWLSKTTGLQVGIGESGGIDPSCDQWHRCYRLPRVVRDGVALRYPLDLSPLLRGPLEWTPSRVPAREAVAAPATGASLITGAPPFPSRDDVTAAEWGVLASARGGLGAECYDAAYKGAPLAKRGGRDIAMVRAIGEVLTLLNSEDAATPWRVLARAVASDTGEGAPTLGKLWDRCQHFAAQRVAALELAEKLRYAPPLLFDPRGRYYVLDTSTGSYGEPVPDVGVVQTLEARCAALGLVTRSPQGKPRPLVELVTQYGQPILRVVARLGSAVTTYDRETRTLYTAACPLRDLPPVEHPDVDAWLRALGGERLLDWLATCTDLTRPTAALYLQGAPGIGKGMLTTALAGLWGASAPTAYPDVAGAFNYGIVTCPVVVIDEGLPDHIARDGWSATFRSMISESARPMTRKYMDPGQMEGCPRVIINANNPDALRLRERLTEDDIDAIGQRILHIHCGRDVGELTRERTADWVKHDDGRPGRIAEHIMHLRATRRVKLGKRFLVEGVRSAYHEDLAISHGWSAAVLSALAHGAVRVEPAPDGILFGVHAREPGVSSSDLYPATVEEAVVLVRVGALLKVWITWSAGGPTPTEGDLSTVLRTLGRQVSRRPSPSANPMRYYAIPARSVARIGELYQIGAIGELENVLLNGKRAPVAGPGRPTPTPAPNT